ncbi:Transposase and inactivated derivatives [Rhizobium sp. 9140]|nr:Transposase and inactivated derivatives [Rhizobium sp. 9140]
MRCPLKKGGHQVWVKVKNLLCGWLVGMEDGASIKVRKIALLRPALNPAHQYRNWRENTGSTRTSFGNGSGNIPRHIHYRRLRHLRLFQFRLPPRAASSTLRCLPRIAKSDCRRRRGGKLPRKAVLLRSEANWMLCLYGRQYIDSVRTVDLPIEKRPQVSRMEIVDSGRRRRFSNEVKLAIVAESYSAPRQVTATARRHGITRFQLNDWRKAAREGRLSNGRSEGFIAALLVPEPGMPAVAPTNSLMTQSGLMEVISANGRRVNVGRDVDVEALLRVLRGLEALR